MNYCCTVQRREPRQFDCALELFVAPNLVELLEHRFSQEKLQGRESHILSVLCCFTFSEYMVTLHQTAEHSLERYAVFAYMFEPQLGLQYSQRVRTKNGQVALKSSHML